MPSRSSSGNTVIIQRWETAGCPVRPIIQESAGATRVPGGACRLAESAASSPPAPPPITSTSVSVNEPWGEVMRRSPRARPVLHRRMHVDDLLGAEDLAAEAGDAVLAEADDGEELRRIEAGQRDRVARRLHVDDIGRAHDVADAAAGT